MVYYITLGDSALSVEASTGLLDMNALCSKINWHEERSKHVSIFLTKLFTNFHNHVP